MRLNECKKIAKSFDELITCFLTKKYKHIVTDINSFDDKVVVSVKVDDLSNEDSELIYQALNDKRNHSLEEFGWELLGESEDSTELELVGALFDEFELTKEGNITSIKLTRYYE